MSAHRNDHKASALRTELGLSAPSGHITTMDRDFLLAEGITAGHINDMRAAWLLLVGATSSNFNLAWQEYLINVRGFTGSLADMMHEYWAGGITGVTTLFNADGDPIQFAGGGFIETVD